MTAFSDARALGGATCRPASFLQFDGPPQRIEADGTPTWIARGANFVVAISRVEAGSELIQTDVPDESMLLLSPAVPVTIAADRAVEEVDEEALAILPPGAARISARGSGVIVRIFSSAAAEFRDAAGNAADYTGGSPDVAPLDYWPDPAGGFALRVYRLRDHSEDVGFGRLFRSTNLMVNLFVPASAPRDLARLSPHDHPDFEQGSLTPWGATSYTICERHGARIAVHGGPTDG